MRENTMSVAIDHTGLVYIAATIAEARAKVLAANSTYK